MSDAVWFRLETLVPEKDTEDLADHLWDIGAQGVEIQDRTTYMESTDAPSRTPENLIPPVPEGKTRLIAFFDSEDDTPPDILPSLDGFDVVSFDRYDDRSWETRWMDWFVPTQISERVSVGPPWAETTPEPGHIHVVIQPGMAFGTGTHETTQLCAQAIDESLQKVPGASLLDVGCGSAILAIIGRLLGATDVEGMDNDPVAIKVAVENLETNHVEDIRLSTDTLADYDRPFDIVVANILAPVLVELRDQLIACVRPNGYLICSGVTTTQREAHETVFLASGELKHLKTQEKGDWICSVWQRQ